MKTTILLPCLVLLLLSSFAAGDEYGDSLGIAKFTIDDKITWETDGENNVKGAGVGVGAVVKGTVVLLNTMDKSKLDWDIETWPESMLEDFAKEESYKKERDMTKTMEDGTVKRYVEAKFKKDGVSVYFLCAENSDYLASVMMTCNKDGKAFKKGVVNKVLKSLKLQVR